MEHDPLNSFALAFQQRLTEFLSIRQAELGELSQWKAPFVKLSTLWPNVVFKHRRLARSISFTLPSVETVPQEEYPELKKRVRAICVEHGFYMPVPVKPSELVARIKKGDETALAEYLGKREKKLTKHAHDLASSGNPTIMEPEDIVNHTCLTAFQAYAKGKSYGNFQAFLQLTLGRVHHRTTHTRYLRKQSDSGKITDIEEEPYDGWVDRLAEQLPLALDNVRKRLSANQQAVLDFMMASEEPQGPTQIALSLNCSESSVYKTRHRIAECLNYALIELAQEDAEFEPLKDYIEYRMRTGERGNIRS